MQKISRVSFAGSLVLAGMAGFVDAVGFILSGGLFVSFMSGNSTQAGVEVSAGSSQTALVAMSLVGGFLLGVIAGRFSGVRIPHVTTGTRIIGLGVALAAAAVIVAAWPAPGYSLAALAAVMGAMNTLFIADGRAQVAITYATGTLVSVGIGVADQVAGLNRGAWIRPFLLWASITLGAVVGTLCWRALDVWALMIAAAVLCVLGGSQLVRGLAQSRARSQSL